MKKIISFIAALVMMMSFCTVAFASEPENEMTEEQEIAIAKEIPEAQELPEASEALEASEASAVSLGIKPSVNPEKPAPSKPPKPPVNPHDECGVTVGGKSYAVKASGNIPENVALSVSLVSDEDIAVLLDGEYPVCDNHVSLDIKLMDGGNEWQPAEGETVSVTVPADMLGLADGEYYRYFHIHGDDVTCSENLPVKDGMLTVTTDSFSVFTLSGKTAYIDGVSRLYDGICITGNRNLELAAVYFDAEYMPHFVFGVLKSTADNGVSKMEFVKINGMLVASKGSGGDGGNIPIGEFDCVPSKTDSGGKCTSLIFRLDGEEIMQISSINGSSVVGFIDILVENTDLDSLLNFYLRASTGQDGNSWNIGSEDNPTPVIIDVDYEIDKTVASVDGDTSRSGDSVQAKPGETVVYEVTVDRDADSYDTPLNAIIKDTLPEGLFDSDEVYYSFDGTDWIKAEVRSDDNSFVITNKCQVSIGGSVTYYVKGTVLEEAEDEIYVNTASIYGAGLITKEDSAEIVIASESGVGALTLTKQVKTADGSIPYYSQFTFHIYDSNNDLIKTITLENGETYLAEVLPAGEYTIMEEEIANFTCAWTNNTKTVQVSKDNTTNVTCINTMGTVAQPGGIKISKTVINAGDTEDTEFIFHIYDSENNHIEAVTLKNGESYTVEGLNAGDYTVVEEACDGYECSWTNNTLAVTVEEGETAEAACENTKELPPPPVPVTASLTIKKQGASEYDENQSFIFNVRGTDENTEGININVIVYGNGETTVSDMPEGEYSVTEITDWAWRYELDSVSFNGSAILEGAEVEILADNTNVMTYTNSREKIYWLSGDSFAVNDFSDKKKEDDAE